jgi:hypothetical protein
MLVKVLWPFLNGRGIAEPGQVLDVSEHRARELSGRLVTPLAAQQAAPEWFPDWRGETCVIVASGPSAKDVPIDAARGRARAIAINNSWQLAPWADALYATDFVWWERNRGVPEFAGLKISQDERLVDRPAWGVRLVTGRNDARILVTSPGEISHGGNSGFAALNLAVQFGVSRMVLVGYDMRVDRGLHWHGKHGDGLNNPADDTVRKWRRMIDGQAPVLAALGVVVINASPISALASYPKMSLMEALGA